MITYIKKIKDAYYIVKDEHSGSDDVQLFWCGPDNRAKFQKSSVKAWCTFNQTEANEKYDLYIKTDEQIEDYFKCKHCGRNSFYIKVEEKAVKQICTSCKYNDDLITFTTGKNDNKNVRTNDEASEHASECPETHCEIDLEKCDDVDEACKQAFEVLRQNMKKLLKNIEKIYEIM